MALDRNNWRSSFPLHDIPHYICPTCNKGLLELDSKNLKEFNSRYSKEISKMKEYEFEWFQDRFITFLQCNNKKCQDYITLIGNVTPEHDYEDGYVSYFYPLLFNPALKIFIPCLKTPEKIVKMLNESFALFWIDKSAAVNKIRIMLEFLMDDQGIERTDTRGKMIALARRIDKFKREHNEDMGKLMEAIKWVGNDGSHAGDIKASDLFDAYEITEYVLELLYEKRKEKLTDLSSKINTAKSSLSKIPNPREPIKYFV
jgi:hypothetical protein